MANQAQQNQFPDLLLKGEEFKQLDFMLGEIPAKYSLPLINFFRSVSNTRFQEAQAAETKVVSETEQGEIKG